MNATLELITRAPDIGAIEEIASNLDLREPNARAIRTMAQRLHERYGSGADGFFEGVVDSATGMGKSFIIAGAIDYFAAQGARNFAIVTPGAAIQDKTINQFTAGHPKSLLPGMMVEPLVVHAGNFDSASMASAFADDEQVKLFIFTIQSLLKPGTKQGRKTHEFKEGLGKAFYEHLDSLEDLVVFADEHHCYGGVKFSDALRGLKPLALFGLTATPDEKAMAKTGIETIFQYPLAAAIADGYVKTPVVVGRRDDLTDEKTQLLDGGVLLRAKERLLRAYAHESGESFIHPIMLVSCKDIDHAEETVAFLRSDQFFDGNYADKDVVLEVHSSQPDAALAALERVEDSGSPTRIIVQVGMLKEGWDVKNVYIIASLRSSVSQVLTEQTLGRGLRLPFGQYVDDPDYQLLNELEVISHERYRDLLAKVGKLSQAFIDYETVIGPDGEPEVRPVAVGTGEDGAAVATGDHHVAVGDVEERKVAAEAAAKAKVVMEPRTDLPLLRVPCVRSMPTATRFTLASITDDEPFRLLGRRLAVDPDKYLARATLKGEIDDATRTAVLKTEDAKTKVKASTPVGSPEEGRQTVVAKVIESPVVTAQKGEPAQIKRLLDLVLEGAGDKADLLLTTYASRLGERLLTTISEQKQALAGSNTQFEDVVRDQSFEPRARYLRNRTDTDRYGKFAKGVAYTGWNKGLYEQAWFDSSPEREMAGILDEEAAIDIWVRLHRDDLPILWNGANQSYNPDFLARDAEGTHWIIEVKDDRHVKDDEVQAKRQSAMTWANVVNATGKYGAWRYLLVSESDLKSAKGTWPVLAGLAT